MAKAKLKRRKDDGTQRLLFKCPGCGHVHNPIVADGTPLWTWNGDLEKPTLSPSVFVAPDWPEARCHSFVKDGRIQFLSDCFHALAGQTVDLPDWG